MLKDTSTLFQTKAGAHKALAIVRRKYRIALRGSVAIYREYPRVGWLICADTSGTGLNSHELSQELTIAKFTFAE